MEEPRGSATAGAGFPKKLASLTEVVQIFCPRDFPTRVKIKRRVEYIKTEDIGQSIKSANLAAMVNSRRIQVANDKPSIAMNSWQYPTAYAGRPVENSQ